MSLPPRGARAGRLSLPAALARLDRGIVRSARSKGAKDPEYLAWIHFYECIVCMGGGIRRLRGTRPRVHAHHAGPRGMSQKADDRTAIPLCAAHHDRGSPISVHALGRKFWEKHDLDKDDLIRRLNELYESLKAREAIK